MLKKQQLITMLALQDDMNSKVNPSWLTAGYAYLRAAMLESSEAIEHHGWKWWKAQTMDLPQLQMELVDIWHFALSDMIILHKGDQEAAADYAYTSMTKEDTSLVFDGKTYNFIKQSLLDNLELMTGLCVARRFDVSLFLHILSQAELSHQMLFEQYVGKNVLNFFRQDNGYKTGTYVKIWAGQEDNVHLVEILNATDPTRQDYAKSIYAQLESRYANA